MNIPSLVTHLLLDNIFMKLNFYKALDRFYSLFSEQEERRGGKWSSDWWSPKTDPLLNLA